MFIKNDSSEDIRMRWQNCVIRYNGNIYSIGDVVKLNSTILTFIGYCYTPIADSTSTWLPFEGTLKLKEIDVSFPSLGAMVFNKRAKYYFLSPRTSRKLGIHTERVASFNMNLGITYSCSSDEIASLFLSNRNYSTKEFLELAEKGQEAVLTKYLYSQKLDLEKGHHMLLFRGRQEVGTIINGKVKVPKLKELFTQELEEAGLSVELIGESNET